MKYVTLGEAYNLLLDMATKDEKLDKQLSRCAPLVAATNELAEIIGKRLNVAVRPADYTTATEGGAAFGCGPVSPGAAMPEELLNIDPDADWD